MKTRVASLILDTHAQDISKVDEESQNRADSLANSASSFTNTTFSKNMSDYAKSAGISLSSLFAASASASSITASIQDGKFNQINASMANQLSVVNALKSTNTDLITYWNQSLLHLPRNNVFWDLDPGTTPGGVQDGDIWWTTPYMSNTRDYSQYVPHKYLNGQWQQVPYQKEFFGAEIYGGKIQGGAIIGATFSSQNGDGIGGGQGRAVFSVDVFGNLHAQSFNANIYLPTGSGHNAKTYTGGDANSGLGFQMNNGIMKMQAYATKLNGDTSDFADQQFFAQTFIEPGGFKLRAYPNSSAGVTTDAGTVLGRTDVRPGRIDINSTSWDDETSFTATAKRIHLGSAFDVGYQSLDVSVPANFYQANSFFEYSEFKALWTQFNHSISVYGAVHCANNVYAVGLKPADISQTSDLSVKKNIKEMDSREALSEIISTDIVQYQYKDTDTKDIVNIGPVIDDVNENKQYYVPEDIVRRKQDDDDNDGISLNNYVSYLALSVQELAKQNREQAFKIAKLERGLTQ